MPRKKRRKNHENVGNVISEQNIGNSDPSYLNRGQYALSQLNPQSSYQYECGYFAWGCPHSNFVSFNALNNAPTQFWTGMEATNAAVPTPTYMNYLYQTDYFHQPQRICPENSSTSNMIYDLQFQPIPTFQFYNPGYFIGQNYRILPGSMFSLDVQRVGSFDNYDLGSNLRQDAVFSADSQNNNQDFPNKRFKDTEETDNEPQYLVEEPDTDKEDL